MIIGGVRQSRSNSRQLVKRLLAFVSILSIFSRSVLILAKINSPSGTYGMSGLGEGWEHGGKSFIQFYTWDPFFLRTAYDASLVASLGTHTAA